MGPLACGLVPGEVDDQPPVGRRGQRHALGVQARRIDAVVLGVVLPDVGAVGDLAQQLVLKRRGGARQDRLEARLDGLAAVAAEQLGHALGAHAARRDLRVQVAAQAVGQARVAHHHPHQVGIRLAAVVQPHGRHDQPFLVVRRAVAGHRAGHAAADVVVVAERLHEGDDLARRGGRAR